MTAPAAARAGFTHHTIAIQQVQLILLGARRHGLAVAPLVQRAGIAPGLLESPQSRVTQAQYAALILVLRHALRDELWGLCSRPLPRGSFAFGCRLLIGCRTLHGALDSGLRYYRLLLSDFAPRLQCSGGMARLALVPVVPVVPLVPLVPPGPPGPRVPPTPALVYAQRCFAFLTYGLMSWLVARRLPLAAVEYPQSELGSSTDADTLFHAPVRYGRHVTGWMFEARWLDLPVVQNEQSLRHFLRQAPVSLLVKYRDQSSLTDRVRRLLRRHLSEEMPSLNQIGRQLALTPQTLRRRLHDEGHSWRQIKDDLRRDAAIDYLARPDLTLPDIAAMLGFSEASTFHRAFKHWTGVAPGAYRQTRLIGS